MVGEHLLGGWARDPILRCEVGDLGEGSVREIDCDCIPINDNILACHFVFFLVR